MALGLAMRSASGGGWLHAYPKARWSYRRERMLEYNAEFKARVLAIVQGLARQRTCYGIGISASGHWIRKKWGWGGWNKEGRIPAQIFYLRLNRMVDDGLLNSRDCYGRETGNCSLKKIFTLPEKT